LVATIAFFTCSMPAQVPATGTIEGRVVNAQSGEFLERARLRVEGSDLETFTDSSGFYRLSNVPSGSVTVHASFTGLPQQTETLAVSAGRTVQRDFDLRPTETVQLQKFVVSTSKEMEGTAFAINEQRYAPNLRDVASTDEFGGVSEGSVGEFLKLMPSVNIEYGGGNAREVSINGVPSGNVPITIDGFDMASAGGFTTGNGNNRAVELDTVALNNLSRIEVVHSPTPESPGSALAGSINMVPRSSFSRSRPELNLSAYVLVRDDELGRDLDKTPGPRSQWTRKIHPGFDVSYIKPVNSRFGFTLSAGSSEQYGTELDNQNFWRGVRTPTNGAAFPTTTLSAPYMTEYSVRNAWKNSRRNSFGASVDLKLTPNDRLNLSFQYGSFDVYIMAQLLQFNVNRVLPGNFGPTFTHGAAGAGTVTLMTNGREANSFNYMPTLKWYHDGSVWRAEAGLGHGRAYTRFRGGSVGMFNLTNVQRTGVTVSFDGIGEMRPETITVTDGATGATVDPYNLASYALNNGSLGPLSVDDTRRTAYANVQRGFSWRLPFTLKAGVDFRQLVHDSRNTGGGAYAFVGADRRATTTPTAPNSDDLAVPFLDESALQRPGNRGFPNIQMVLPEKLYQHFQTNPAHFTRDEAAAHQAIVNASTVAEEIVSSAYIRGDIQAFKGRLKLTGGLRAEQTNLKAQGPLNDRTRNVQRNANGQPVRGPNGAVLPITTDPVAAAHLTMIDRGSRNAKEYLRYFPNFNASYNLRENLILRAAHYVSIGRPNYNQYAGGITLPDTDLGPLPTNRLSVNNVGIKAWTARTTKVRLEHYFERVGLVSVGAFRREFENFFGSTVFNATPEFLALYGLDPSLYGGYEVSTNHNLPGTVRMDGLEFGYKQALTFLPSWARGVQVFANANTLRAVGDNVDSFTGVKIIPRAGSWGISLTREKFNLRANWTYASRQRRGPGPSGQSIDPDNYNWFASRMALDLKGEYLFRRRFAAFFNLQNVTNEPTFISEIAGPSTPAYARTTRKFEFPALWTFGIRAKY
jgi:iron complex outermembrane receptor protein